MAKLVNNTHSKSVEDTDKATLETLPEEVSLEIINVIKNSSDSSGREFMTRPTGTRLRDSTLSRASMVSTKFYSLWFPSLIENLTFSWIHLDSIRKVIERGNNSQLVKSLYVHQWHVEDESGSHFSTEGETEVELETVYLAFQAILEKTSNLETLIITDPGLFFNFLQRVDGKTIPLRFLTHSLKKLWMPLVASHDTPFALNLKNVVWLLMFCPHLSSASISFTIDIFDYEFLEEHESTIKSMSRIKELAIRFVFIHEKENIKTWWNFPAEQFREWIGGNKKTEILYRLLEVTKQLKSLELTWQFDESNPEDGTPRSAPCLNLLKGAYSSFDTLVSLRVFEIGPKPDDPSSFDFSPFKNLEVLSSNWAHLGEVVLNPDSAAPKLEVLSLDFVNYEPELPLSFRFAEERRLLQVLQQVSWPCLKEVVVPLNPHHSGGWEFDHIDQESRKIWNKTRKNLEQADIFRNGGVKLRKFVPGEPIVRDGATPISSIIFHPW